MNSACKCMISFTILVLVFIVCTTIFIHHITPSRTLTDSCHSKALASIDTMLTISKRDSAKQLNGTGRPLLASIDGLSPIDSALIAANASSVSPTLPSVSKCPAPQPGQLCVPQSLAELNSTCPKSYDRVRLNCGSWQPTGCSASDCVSILVPYRNRITNLLLLVNHLHNILQQQHANYRLYVVEQEDQLPFNRAKLLNIGYSLSRKFHACRCYVFHDADKLPQNMQHLYSCDAARPRHMIGRMYNPATRKYAQGKMYHNFFGGVSALTEQQFESVNGNSNLYFGWGREDDELASRLRVKRWRIRYSESSAVYVNIGHASDITVNTMPWPSDASVRRRMAHDGLNSLQYNLTGTYCHQMFTLLTVRL